MPANKWPSATSWRVDTCGKCPNAHVILTDEHGVDRAQFTLSRDQVDRFAQACLDTITIACRINLKNQTER